MTFTHKQLAQRARTQLKHLSMHFESITDLELRDRVIYFMERVGEAAGIERNHSAIKKTLVSDDVFDRMVGKIR